MRPADQNAQIVADLIRAGGTLINSGAAPSAPTATAASSIVLTSFSANWNSSATATGYRLDVATDAGFTSFVSGFNNRDVSNVLTFSVTGLTAGTSYFYRVRAYNGTGTSASSNTINPSTLLVNEDCEGAGTPAGWTNSGSPTPNWDYTTTPIGDSGTQSLNISSTGNTSTDFTGQTTCFAKFKVRWITGQGSPASEPPFADINDTLVNQCGIHSLGAGGSNLTISIRTAAGLGSSSTQTLSTNTTYYAWLKFVKNTSAEIAISATNSKPSSDSGGNVYLLVSSGVGNVNISRVAFNGGTDGNVIIDDIKVGPALIA